MTARPRPRPCPSCPYRRDVPSGVWDPSEYVKLRRYDGDTGEQSPAVFMCHQADGFVCSGWLGHKEYPADLLAVRIAGMCGHLDESCLDYVTDVPLWSSGAEAAEHGLARVEDPAKDASVMAGKIVRKRCATAARESL